MEKVLNYLTGILCLILLGALFIQVLNRYVFGISWPFIQFLIPLCFVWMCLLGSAVGVRRNMHFEVDLLAKFLGPRSGAVQKLLMILMVFGAGGLIAWTAIGFSELGLLKKNPATGVKMIYIYSSLLVGGGLISLMVVEKFFEFVSLGATEEKEETP